jgi:hypothetical protein
MPIKRHESFQQSIQKWELAKLDPHGGNTGISTATFIFHVIHEGFVGNVPVDILDKFPGAWAVVTFVLTYVIFIGCYIGFFAWAFVDGLNQTFISLDSTAGNCNTVSKPLTGTYLASNAGAWQGDARFEFSDAVYQFQFNEFTADSAEFKRLITTDFSLSSIGAFTAENDIATNLLVWMHYRKLVVTENNKVQVMKLYSSPSDVFDRAVISGGTYLNTAPGSPICLSTYTGFDVTTAATTVTFKNTTNCSPVLRVMGGLAQPDGDLFRLKIKLTSFTTAAAINKNILSMAQLEELAILDTVEIAGRKFNVTSMYDPVFQHANTLVCADLNGSFPFRDYRKQACLIDANSILLLPVLAHADEHCASCEDDASKATIPCNAMRLLPFYIFFPNLVGDKTAQNLMFFDLFMRASNAELTKAASKLYMHQNATLFDALCPQCGILWVHLGDNARSVSPYRRLLPNGAHCTDSVSSPHFGNLGATPPATLNEKYYKCRATLPNNIINAVGLAFGNTSVFAVTFLAMLLPFLFWFTKKVDPHRRNVKKYMHAPKLFEDIAHVDEKGDVIVEREKSTDTVSERRLKRILSTINVEGLSNKVLRADNESNKSSQHTYTAADATPPITRSPQDWCGLSDSAESHTSSPEMMLPPPRQISEGLYLGLNLGMDHESYEESKADCEV